MKLYKFKQLEWFELTGEWYAKARNIHYTIRREGRGWHVSGDVDIGHYFKKNELDKAKQYCQDHMEKQVMDVLSEVDIPDDLVSHE